MNLESQLWQATNHIETEGQQNHFVCVVMRLFDLGQGFPSLTLLALGSFEGLEVELFLLCKIFSDPNHEKQVNNQIQEKNDRIVYK